MLAPTALRRARRPQRLEQGAARRGAWRRWWRGRGCRPGRPGRVSERVSGSPSPHRDAQPRRARPASPRCRRRAPRCRSRPPRRRRRGARGAVGERLGDLLRRPRRGARSARPGRPRARPWPRSSRRRARPGSSPRSRDSSVRRAGEQAARAGLGGGERQAARPSPRSSAATCSSTVLPSSENSVSAWRRRTSCLEGLVGLLGVGLVARDDLDLAAFQAGRHLEPLELHALALGRRAASRRSPTRGSRTGAASAAGRRSPRRSRRAARPSRAAADHIGCSSRGGPGSTTTVGPPRPLWRRHDEPGSGAHRLEHGRAPRARRLLAVALPGSPPCRGSASAWRAGAGSSAIRSSSASSSTISRPWKPPTTSAVRSSAVGPSPPLVSTRSSPSPAMKRERREHVLRAVADDRRVREVDADLAQPLGEPRAVAVADPAREHLGARHDDAGARAHAALTCTSAAARWARGWRPRAFVIE